MMPNSIRKSVDGLHGGTLIIAGIIYTLLGITWWVAPSAARLAGIDWIPFTFINDTTVGAMWVGSGVVSVITGFLTRGRTRLTNIAFYLSVFVPTLLGIYFLLAFFMGESPRTLITMISYFGYAALVGWVGSRPECEGRTP